MIGKRKKKGARGRKKAATPTRIIPPSAARSKRFARSRNRAERLIRDPEKLQKLAEDSAKDSASRSRPFVDIREEFRALVRLVSAYSRGDYRDIPLDALVLIVAGVVYVLSPIDLIPDFIPGIGYLDDAAVVAWVLKTVRHEVEAFRQWEQQGPDRAQDVNSAD